MLLISATPPKKQQQPTKVEGLNYRFELNLAFTPNPLLVRAFQHGHANVHLNVYHLTMVMILEN